MDVFIDSQLISIISVIQFLCLCKTRLANEIENLYKIKEFNMYIQNRNRHGGGVVIFVKNAIKCMVIHEISIANDCIEFVFLDCGTG